MSRPPHSPGGRQPSRRPEQVAAILHRAIQARIDKGLADPRIRGMITITGVKLSPDLRTATVQVSVMPHEKQELTLHGLRSAARHIRHDVGDEVAIHQMPELTFRLDHALEHQAGVLDALARAARERAEREGSDPAGRPQSAESAGKDAYAQGPQEDGPA